MKTLKHLVVIALLIISNSSFAFAKHSNKKEYREVDSFNAIEVSSGIDLHITMGNVEEVKVIADEDVLDKVKTEVKDGTLFIFMQSEKFWNWNFNKSREVYITVKELLMLNASAGSDVYTKNTLKGNKLEVNVSSGSDVELDVFYKNFSISTSSGSDAEISGKVKYLQAKASSGSDIEAHNLEAQICHAEASSGADITVHALDEIVAKASSGGDITYFGKPRIREIDESSGGDVSKR